VDNFIELEIDGQSVTLDVGADLEITDLDEDMDAIAGLLGWYGNVIAAVKESAAIADANYRAWRARRTESILAKDPKLAEYKVRAKIDADPEFLKHKRHQAEVDRLLSRLFKAWHALDRKADILQSKGAVYRAELRSTGMHTKADPDHPDQGGDSSEEERRRAVAEATRDNRRRRRRRRADPSPESESETTDSED
jgi:hypothetical protein